MAPNISLRGPSREYFDVYIANDIFPTERTQWRCGVLGRVIFGWYIIIITSCFCYLGFPHPWCQSNSGDSIQAFDQHVTVLDLLRVKGTPASGERFKLIGFLWIKCSPTRPHMCPFPNGPQLWRHRPSPAVRSETLSLSQASTRVVGLRHQQFKKPPQG